jgi:radical SAM protein with 4Fe4S-binding SPASM domain
MGGGSPDTGELNTEAMKRALDVLAGLKVFHVAMGGGEALERSDLFEIADYARQLGLVPNLTVSGRGLTAESAERMRIFGQVNVSLDGVGALSGVFRGRNTFQTADRALELLVKAGVPAGINCVVGRRNFDGLAALFEYAEGRDLNEIEFLRFKPAGRGARLYEVEKTTFTQNVALAPLLVDLSQQYGVTAKIDCSFVPMLCYHNPDPDLLDALATYGCEAGNVLLGIRSDGQVSGCSFLPAGGISVFDLPSVLKEGTGLGCLYNWAQQAPEPCRSCPYVETCKGGCHGVSLHATGSCENPDPDCPRVVEHRGRGKP